MSCIDRRIAGRRSRHGDAADLRGRLPRGCPGSAACARFRPANDVEIGGLKVSGSSGYAEGRSRRAAGHDPDRGRRACDGPRAARCRKARLRAAGHLPGGGAGRGACRSPQVQALRGRRPGGGARADALHEDAEPRRSGRGRSAHGSEIGEHDDARATASWSSAGRHDPQAADRAS